MNTDELSVNRLRWKEFLILLACVVGGIFLLWIFSDSATKEESSQKSTGGITISTKRTVNTPSYTSLTTTNKSAHTTEVSETDSTKNPLSLSEFLKERGLLPEITEFAPSKEISLAGAEELKNYGNAAGKIIQTNTDKTLHETTIFNSLINDAENSGIRAEAKKIAEQYLLISEKLNGFIPGQLSTQIHTDLVRGYSAVGQAMRILVSSDLAPENYLTYNESLPTFIDGYMGVALLLRAYGITFEESEPGYIFTLNL